MKIIEEMDWGALQHEYGVDAKRLLPWSGVVPPFGGAWVVVAPHSTSLAHVNEPADEEEFFICVSGRARVFHGTVAREIQDGAIVYFPSGERHWIENEHDEPCRLYCLWWNDQSVDECVKSRREKS